MCVCVCLHVRDDGEEGVRKKGKEGREGWRKRKVFSRYINDHWNVTKVSTWKITLLYKIVKWKVIKWLKSIFLPLTHLSTCHPFRMSHDFHWVLMSFRWRPRCSMLFQSHLTPWARSNYMPPPFCQRLVTFPVLRGQAYPSEGLH